MYDKLVKIMRTITWLLVAYVTYVFLRNVGISPYDLIDQVHEIAYYFLSALGA